jgi:ring-1,2-phenylacetyl-CoA epoxidase subunit PaaB
MTEGTVNVYDQLATVSSSGAQQQYEIFQLAKRGKQHVHAGSVMAGSPEEAMSQAKEKFNSGKTVYNVWAIPTSSIRFTTPEEKDFWITLPEKRFRDAADYKGGDKLKNFLERTKN